MLKWLEPPISRSLDIQKKIYIYIYVYPLMPSCSMDSWVRRSDSENERLRRSTVAAQSASRFRGNKTSQSASTGPNEPFVTERTSSQWRGGRPNGVPRLLEVMELYRLRGHEQLRSWSKILFHRRSFFSFPLWCLPMFGTIGFSRCGATPLASRFRANLEGFG